jgi:hypothetical protein
VRLGTPFAPFRVIGAQVGTSNRVRHISQSPGPLATALLDQCMSGRAGAIVTFDQYP